MKQKRCATCKQLKSIDHFWKNKRSKDGFNSACKQCRREYYQRNDVRERTRKYKREWARNNYNPIKMRWANLKSNYGITKESFLALHEEQNGLCAICGKVLATSGHHICVDHDHVTGKLRGLLCKNCNIILGNAKDNIEILLSAAKYLQNYEGK